MKQYGVTIKTENEMGTKEFDEEVFGKMKQMMESITKDMFKEPIAEFYKMPSNGTSWVVWKKEIINKRGMFTKHILCYKKTKEEAEFSRQRYELAWNKNAVLVSNQVHTQPELKEEGLPDEKDGVTPLESSNESGRSSGRDF